MDTSDSRITFDENGVCDHCRGFETNVRPRWRPDERGRAEVGRTIEAIKRAGKGKQFDSILGLSGGLDSSYMLHLVVKEFGLRPLVFHVDGGWNSDIAVSNIENLVNKLALDLYTEVINWEEMRDFQLAFFKSGVPHIDLPQDLFIELEKCRDDKQIREVGIDWCIQQSKELKKANVACLHYYTMGTSDSTKRVAKEVF